MKIALASDIHLEFGWLDVTNENKADVLILAGDIILARHFSFEETSAAYHTFFDNLSTEFSNVIYVLGNHEHYNYNINNTYNKIKYELAPYSNIHLLEKASVVIDGIKFIGGTMWSDFNNNDPTTMFFIKSMMADFNIINNGDRTFTPEDAFADHLEFLSFLVQELKDSEGESIVMVTHHSPSLSTINPKYSYEVIMNGGYSSNLDNLIINNPKIKLWVAGHQHDRYDFMIGPTRLVNNARGYFGQELQAIKYSLKYLEI